MEIKYHCIELAQQVNVYIVGHRSRVYRDILTKGKIRNYVDSLRLPSGTRIAIDFAAPQSYFSLYLYMKTLESINPTLIIHFATQDVSDVKCLSAYRRFKRYQYSIALKFPAVIKIVVSNMRHYLPKRGFLGLRRGFVEMPVCSDQALIHSFFDALKLTSNTTLHVESTLEKFEVSRILKPEQTIVHLFKLTLSKSMLLSTMYQGFKRVASKPSRLNDISKDTPMKTIELIGGFSDYTTRDLKK